MSEKIVQLNEEVIKGQLRSTMYFSSRSQIVAELLLNLFSQFCRECSYCKPDARKYNARHTRTSKFPVCQSGIAYQSPIKRKEKEPSSGLLPLC